MKKEKYIGLTINEAIELADKEDFITRVISVDGVPSIITADYRKDRINLEIKNKIISNAFIG